MNPEDIKHDLFHTDKYEAFCRIYGIEDILTVVKLYDIFELVSFFPPKPTEHEKKVLQSLIGIQAESGYMDYQRSNNTFELIMQWQEQTDNLANTPLPFQTPPLHE
jgi:hypothetical protein